MNYADIILQSVSMREVAERYGFEVNRQGFTHCPFHSEKTASLKIYSNNKGFYCFGCGTGGNLIDFVEKLYSLSFIETIKKINVDFCLNLPIGERMTLKQKDRFNKAQKKLEAMRKERYKAEQERELAYNKVTTELVRLDNNLRRYKPSESNTELHPLFVEALQNVDKHYYYNYLPLAGGDDLDNNGDDQRTNFSVVRLGNS